MAARAHGIPATQGAEVGGSLEPGAQRLQWTEISPLYSSLDDRAGPSKNEWINNFCSAKYAKRMKRQAKTLRKYLQKQVPDKELVSKTYRVLKD